MLDMRSLLCRIRSRTRGLGDPFALDERGAHRDGVERVAQVMPQNPDEHLREARLVLGLEPPPRLGGQLVLGTPAFGEIAGDLGKPPQLTAARP